MSPGGRFPPSFIHQVILITGLNKLYCTDLHTFTGYAVKVIENVVVFYHLSTKQFVELCCISWSVSMWHGSLNFDIKYYYTFNIRFCFFQVGKRPVSYNGM